MHQAGSISQDAEQAIAMAVREYDRDLRDAASRGIYGRVIHETYFDAGRPTQFEGTTRKQSKLRK